MVSIRTYIFCSFDTADPKCPLSGGSIIFVDEPVRIMPNQLAHFETIGWFAKNPNSFTKENKIKEVINTAENQENGNN